MVQYAPRRRRSPAAQAGLARVRVVAFGAAHVHAAGSALIHVSAGGFDIEAEEELIIFGLPS